MPYKTVEVDSEAMFLRLEKVIWHANHHPYQPHFSAYHPVFGLTAADRKAALLRSVMRKWNAHTLDPSSHWIAVIDDSDDTVVGGCQWKFHLSDPYSGPGSAAYDPSVWPEGSTGRAFVETMMQRQYAHRKRWLRRPHAVRQQMAVHPQHRKRGIGSLLMTWGMNRAQEHGLGVFLHSTEMARHLYERHGLRVLQKVELDMEILNPSDEWEKLRHDFGPLRFFIMWKPEDGVYEEGQTQLPWEISLA